MFSTSCSLPCSSSPMGIICLLLFRKVEEVECVLRISVVQKGKPGKKVEVENYRSGYEYPYAEVQRELDVSEMARLLLAGCMSLMSLRMFLRLYCQGIFCKQTLFILNFLFVDSGLRLEDSLVILEIEYLIPVSADNECIAL